MLRLNNNNIIDGIKYQKTLDLALKNSFGNENSRATINTNIYIVKLSILKVPKIMLDIILYISEAHLN